MDIKVKHICDKEKIYVIVLEQNTDSEKSIDKTQVSNIQIIAHDWWVQFQFIDVLSWLLLQLAGGCVLTVKTATDKHL